MASVLICCTPAHGHVVPVLIVAKHLVEQGHDVRVLTGSHYAVKVRTSGAEFLPLPPDADIDLDNTEVDYPERAAMKPIPQLRFSVIEFFIKPVRGQVRAVDAAIAERPVDIILTEMMFMGAAILRRRPRAQRPAIATLGYVPMAASDPDVAPFGLGITPMPGPVGRLRNAVLKVVARRIFAPVYDIAGRLFDELAGEPLPPGFDLFDLPMHTDRLLQFTVPSFEYPRSTLPATVRFIGPMPSAPADVPLPAWWDDLDGSRPVVHVSQGTIANRDFSELIIPTMQALADEDLLVVASTGGRPVASLGILPENARAAEYLPYDRLFPKLAVFVTNGGYGGLQYSLQHGVPMVAAGTSEDKLETTARVEWSGAGIRLKTNHPTPEQLRRAVHRVLGSPSYRAAAERIGAEIAVAPRLAGVDAAIAELVGDAAGVVARAGGRA